MLTADNIEAALSLDYEATRIEVKGPGARTDTHLLAKVARAALSMGNMRDGGHVIVGIADDRLSECSPGLEAEDLASWLAYDDLGRKLAEYADPPLRFRVAGVKLESRVEVAVIQVFEFADIPHLCAKSYQGDLRKGALYVRSRKLPETAEVATSVELRDVIHLATEKALRAYIETAERAGIMLGTSANEPEAPSDAERFQAERERGWNE